MSILNKLKNLNTRKAARLLENHPLTGESLELRLQYLAGVALAIAIDREPSEGERMAFNALADSLAVDPADAQEQLDERASVTEEDIALLFAAIRERDAGYLYLLDLAWIHAADKQLDENEIAVTEQLAELLEINEQAVTNLHDFSLALPEKGLCGNLPLIVKLWQYEALRDLIKPLTNRHLLFFGIVGQHWIDHGDCTATDTKTGITWIRKSVGKIAISQTILKTNTSESITEKLKELGLESAWRAPTPEELKEILKNGALPEEVFLEKLESSNIFTTKTQENLDKSDNYEECQFEIVACKKEEI